MAIALHAGSIAIAAAIPASVRVPTVAVTMRGLLPRRSAAVLAGRIAPIRSIRALPHQEHKQRHYAGYGPD